MDDSDEYEIVKMEIRSLLISNKEGCLLSEFKKQYRSMLGRPLPFVQFGCKNEIEFLSTMADVVHMRSTGRDYHLFGIADENTKHIQKMVSKQKTSSKKKTSGRLNPMSRANSRVYVRTQPVPRAYDIPTSSSVAKKPHELPTMSSVTKKPHDLPTTSSVSKRSYELPPRFQNPKVKKEVPKFVVNEIVDLVFKYPTGLSLRDVLVGYRQMYNRELSFKDYGFFTLQECLEEIPFLTLKPKLNDTIVLCLSKPERPSYSECLKMKDDVTKGRPTDYAQNTNEGAGCVKYVDYEYFENKNKSANNEVPKNSAATPSSAQSYIGADSPKGFCSKADIPLPFESTTNANHNAASASFKESHGDLSMKGNHLDDLNFNIRESSDESTISDKIRDNLIRVIENCQHGIWAREFPALYKEITRTEFDLHNLGFYDLASFIDSVPDILTRRSLPNSKKDYLIYPAWSRNEMDRNDPKSAAFAIEIIIGNTRKILQANEEGVTLKEFLYVYSLNCAEPLYYVDLGFDSLENLLIVIADRVPLKFETKGGVKSVHLDGNQDKSFLPPPKDIEPLPANVVSPFQQFTQQTLPTQLDLGQFFPVYVCSVITPEHLYLQLEETSETLAKEYRELEKFYNTSLSKSYVMKDAHIAAGSIGAALWPSDMHWYRVRIMSVMSPETVRVFYVDYGTIEIIPKSLLRYLREEFFDLPTQAIKASLAYVKPPFPDNMWNSQAKARILELCTDITIMAKIHDIQQDGLLSIVLCDTNGEQDVYINDVLLDEHLARNSSDADSNFHRRNPQERPPSHLAIPPPTANLLSTNANQALPPPVQATDPTQVIGMLLQAYSSLAANKASPAATPNFNPMDPTFVNAVAQAAQNLAQNPLAFTPGFSTQLQTPLAPVTSPIPGPKPPVNANWQYPTTSLNLPEETASASCHTPSSEESSEVFDDDVDAFFDEFYQKVSLVTKRYVKRIRTGDGYMFHILIHDSKPFVSCGDISSLIWSNKNPDYLVLRLQNLESTLPDKLLFENKNEEMFEQLKRFHVKGFKEHNDQTCIQVYPLNTLVQILNTFGHPSAELRSKILSESASFNAKHPMWMELSEVEIPDGEEEFAGKTDDDKLNRLCLYDLQTMKQGIRIRCQNLDLRRNKSPEGVADEEEKLRVLYGKVMGRIKEIEQICSNFSDV